MNIKEFFHDLYEANLAYQKSIRDYNRKNKF